MTELAQGDIAKTFGEQAVAYQTTDILDSRGEKAVARRTVYVYQAPVRLWHWLNAAAMTVLFVTGYLIASPPASLSGEASAHFQMGYIRFAHFAAGQVMAAAFLRPDLLGFRGQRPCQAALLRAFLAQVLLAGLVAGIALVFVPGKISQAICRA